MELVDHKVETPDLVVNYLRAGKGPPLVLLHGWPEFCRSWKKNIAPLAAFFDVIAPDLRGFGETRRRDNLPVEKTTAGLLGADLTAFLDALKVDRVGLVSHDVGAYVAQNFARKSPGRTAALFFFNCPYPGVGTRWGEGPYLPEAFYQYLHQWPLAEELIGYNRDTCRIYFRHFLRHWSANPHAFDDDLEMWVDNFMKPGNLKGGFEWYRGALAMRLKWMKEGAPQMDPITCPTRVFWGDSDAVCPAEWGDRLGEYFSDLKFSKAPRAGHFVHYEQAALSNEEMLTFFNPLRSGEKWR
jgi:pimeloyl-ACP methyl ester carboxylesterase